MKKLIGVLLFLILFLFPNVSYAALGVGVGVGKIEVDDQLKPGVIYTLPSITVLNTGDESSAYEVAIEHHENQPESVPEEDWFIFSPKEFTLEPGEVQEVQIKLNLPVNVAPDDYFAYVEARPIKKTPVGNTAVNIAAATKLYFTVIPGSVLSGIYYKILTFWKEYSPWPQIVVTGILVVLSIFLVKRFFNIEIKLAKQGVPKWILLLSAVVFFLIYLVFWMKVFEMM